jgi:hypothetical protein
MTPPSEEQCIPFPCPNCGTEIRKTIGWFLRNDHVGCDCGVHMTVDASALRAGLAAALAARTGAD